MKKILLLSLLLLSLILVTGCVQLDAPKVNYIDSRVTQVTLQGAEVEFYFNIENKNPVPIDITGYNYKISINGRELLNENRNGFTVQSGESKKITLPIFVRYDKVFDSIIGIAADIIMGKTYFDYRVEGSVSAGALGLTVTAPIKAEGRVKIPKEYLNL